uniref:Uncharacterized protein n=1 Tax=Plectus sambesii TaxID=2011161 RepID=A0A914WWG7_9BILA
HAGGFSNNGPPGPPGPHNPRLIRPPNGAGPMPGPPNPTPLASVGLGPRGPLQFSGPLLNELAPRPMMGAFVGRMDAPRPLHPGRPGPMMPNRPHFFDRR